MPVIAVRLASRCARGLAAVHPTASVSHCGAFTGLASGSCMCAAPWGLVRVFHRVSALHGLVVCFVKNVDLSWYKNRRKPHYAYVFLRHVLLLARTITKVVQPALPRPRLGCAVHPTA